ncbi:MAG TPA: hypothetical protein VNJ12_08140 [Candidatus Dormibacteraeota bacterium]|nr:hypothetical protein [Candidatus Dormibacteraeota bacterium]
MANTDDLTRGASRALNQTITEITEFLEDNAKRPGGRGADLREFLRKRIADIGYHWYKRGIRRGHMEAYKKWKKTERVSKTFRFKAGRDFFEGQTRRVRVTSKIKT